MSTSTYKLLPLQGPTSLASTALAAIDRIPTYTYARSQSDIGIQPQKIASDKSLDIPNTPGGGLTRRFLASIPKDWTIPTACILEFVMEGDNRADAVQLANVVVQSLGLSPQMKGWKEPESWSIGLFGSPPDQTLYG